MRKTNQIPQIDWLIARLPEPLRLELDSLPATIWEQVQEIRIQAERSVWLSLPGRLLPMQTRISQKELEKCFSALCEYSVHTYLPQICQGFLTVRGGHRIGLGGTAVIQHGTVVSIRQLSSLNIRLSRIGQVQIQPFADRLFGDGLHSVLIAGAPASGKTTLLRALAQYLSHTFKVTVIDERGEIMEEGAADCGGCLDVLRGFPKATGILQAVRTLSPQVVVCDELGSGQEIEQLLEAVHCGTALLAAIHAGNLDELLNKPQFCRLQQSNTFERIVMLKGAEHPACPESIYSRTQEGWVKI